MASKMKYVIGDIHGEYKALRKLICHLQKDATEYIFLGDFIDKGKEARTSIDLLVDLSKSIRCVFLMGDHEYAWLKYLEGEERFLNFILNYGGISTLESYLGRKLTMKEARVTLSNRKLIRELLEIHKTFYSNLKFYHQVNNEFICVHAGINPENKDIPLELHDKEELVFIRDKFIYSKFFYQGKKVIFGHTAFKEPYVDRYKIGIDTGIVYSKKGSLTAFNIDERFFIDHTNKKSDFPELCKV